MTGDDGRFSFDALPAGALTLQLRSPTTSPADTTVTVTPGKRLSLTIHVDSQERYTSVVRGRRAQVETVEQTLQAEEIRYIPGTQGDTLKAVQNLPGVARAPYGDRPAAGVGIVARRHARLPRRHQHPRRCTTSAACARR